MKTAPPGTNGSRAPTIVPPAGIRHKSRAGICIFLLLAGLGPFSAAAGQGPRAASAPPPIGPWDLLTTSAAGALFVAPQLFGWGPETSPCAPCDPADLPGFDRWALHAPRARWSGASTVLLVALAGAAEADLAFRPGGTRHAVALVQSVSWAIGATEVLKHLAGRKRPVLYTTAAPGDVAADDLRSFPSGHAAGAFAAATSYWLSRVALDDGRRPVPPWLALVAAGGVGTMRVVAGRHFPSDVVAGAAMGAASALVVHTIRF